MRLALLFVIAASWVAVESFLDAGARRDCELCTRKKGYFFLLTEADMAGVGNAGRCLPDRFFLDNGCRNGRARVCSVEDCGSVHATARGFVMDLQCGGTVNTSGASKLICRDSDLSFWLGRPRPRLGALAVAEQRAIRNFLVELEGDVYGTCDRCVAQDKVFVVQNTTTGYNMSCETTPELRKKEPWPAEMSRLIARPHLCVSQNLMTGYGESMRMVAIDHEILGLLKRGDERADWYTGPYY